MVRQRWLKITNGQGLVGVASKHNQPTSLASLSNSSTNSESSPNTISQPPNNIQSIVNSFNEENDVFDFIKKHQLITPPQQVQQPVIEKQPIKKPVQPISLDSLTCDEELFDQRSAPTEPKSTCPPSIKDIDPAITIDSTVSSSLGTLLDNNYDLMDFHSSLQTNLEREWLNQIFSQDF